uniref:Transglycosylase n=1 Tax=viral metagenome TaxID=1070528 RepID=A0A6H1ZLJ4_9ZZZZ
MSFDKHQFRDFIDRTLKVVELHSEAATDLLLKTAAHESKFGTYLRQVRGPALGVFQIEPDTEKDIWLNYLRFNSELTEKIKKFTGIDGPNHSALEGDLRYQVIMARLVYRRIKFPLPSPIDILGQAKYWKKHYNTMLGAGNEIDFVKAAEKYVGV